MQRQIIILFFLLISQLLLGQEEWTLEKCTEFAINNNLNLKTSQFDVQLSKDNLDQTKFNYFPTLNGNASHGYNWGQRIDPFTNEFATQRVRSNNFYLSSSLTLFSGLQNYYMQQQAKTDYKIQEYNIEIQERNLKIDVAVAYLQVILNKEILLTYKEQLKLTEEQKKRIEILIDAGKNTKSNLFEIEAQIALDELNITKSNSDIETSILSLKQLINLPQELNFIINQKDIELDLLQSSEINYAELPEIKQVEERLNSSIKSLQISKGRAYPTLSINASLGSGFSGNSQELINNELVTKSFNKQLDNNFYQSASLSLNIPIFYKFQTRNSIQRAKIEVERAKVNQDRIIQELRYRIEKLKIDIENAKAQLTSSEKALKTAQLSSENAKIKYEAGIINFTTFNEINTKLFSAQSSLIQAKFQQYFKTYLLGIYNLQK